MPTLTPLLAPIVALGLVAGCAMTAPGNPTTSSAAPTLAMYLKYAGPPIDSFTYLGHYSAFRTMGGKDVVIWTDINDAYLIRVLDPCVELPFADKIGLTSTAHTVTRGFDSVLVGEDLGASGSLGRPDSLDRPDAARTADRCRIDSIRHIDYLAMKKAHIAGP